MKFLANTIREINGRIEINLTKFKRTRQNFSIEVTIVWKRKNPSELFWSVCLCSNIADAFDSCCSTDAATEIHSALQLKKSHYSSCFYRRQLNQQNIDEPIR
ncbi:hypothetical protein TNCT_28871 [Trichonephila clavata]|uniref:Uncharacterized protein n=1 Tax=Trichonephila clavata TaxID=2740835 RepID=A0A8X6M3X5_TRICU|nr:hypothetical protein TNCT_28871 [Trichonephila clavata]